MDDLDTVKLWEITLRQEIKKLKASKEAVLSNILVAKAEKDRVIDLMRTLKMKMIQVISRCAQLQSDHPTGKNLNLKVKNLKLNYKEIENSLAQLAKTVKPRARSLRSSFRKPSYMEDIPKIVEKEFEDVSKEVNELTVQVEDHRLLQDGKAVEMIKEQIEEHRHLEYEIRIEMLEAENQELKRNLGRILDHRKEIFGIINWLGDRIERLEKAEEVEKDKGQNGEKRRILLQINSNAEDLTRSNAQQRLLRLLDLST